MSRYQGWINPRRARVVYFGEITSKKERTRSVETLEKFTKVIPIAYLYLVILSFVGNQSYYEQFGIEITHYMSVQELATSPLHDISGLVYSMIIIIGFGLLISLFFGLLDLVLFLIKSNISGHGIKLVKSNLANGLWDYSVTALIVSALVITSINVRNKFDIFPNFHPNSYFYLSIILSFSVYLLNRLSIKFKKIPPQLVLFLISYILLNTYYFLKYDEGSAIFSGNRLAKTIDIRGQKDIHKNLHLIGESASHLFTFHKQDSTTHVFKKQDISEIIYINTGKTKTQQTEISRGLRVD